MSAGVCAGRRSTPTTSPVLVREVRSGRSAPEVAAAKLTPPAKSEAREAPILPGRKCLDLRALAVEASRCLLGGLCRWALKFVSSDRSTRQFRPFEEPGCLNTQGRWRSESTAAEGVLPELLLRLTSCPVFSRTLSETGCREVQAGRQVGSFTDGPTDKSRGARVRELPEEPLGACQ